MIRYDILRQRLTEQHLVPVETRKDGNCFFRAVAHMLYGDDSLHNLVRRQSVEHISDNPEFYQDYFLRV